MVINAVSYTGVVAANAFINVREAIGGRRRPHH
jgi:hypothetical protein